MTLTRRELLRDALAASVAAQALTLPAAASAASRPHRYAREAHQVRELYLEAWRAYRRYAWGADELRPVSRKGSPFFLPHRSVGLTIFEAIDTLYLMGFDHEVGVARRWLVKEFDPAIDGEVSVFETTIRLLGGLLAAHHVTRDPALLRRARELADRIMPAFEHSPTGMPFQRVNLATGAVAGPILSIGEATNLGELGRLSWLTGDGRYFAAGRRAAEAIVARRSSLDLLPTSIDVRTGAWADPDAGIDPPVDSFFESLYDGWVATGDRALLKWFRLLEAATLRHQFFQRADGRWWFRHVDFRTGATTRTDASELGIYYAGLLAQAGERTAARRYIKSWAALLERYALLPERVDSVSGAVIDPQNQLRPEYADACLAAWLATRDERYRHLAARAWRRERKHFRVKGRGVTVALDVTSTPVRLGDLTPGYWFSESPKYYWLMFSETPRFNYRRNLLSTEGKLLLGARRRR